MTSNQERSSDALVEIFGDARITPQHADGSIDVVHQYGDQAFRVQENGDVSAYGDPHQLVCPADEVEAWAAGRAVV